MRNGFTLVEIIVVIFIISIFTSITLLNYRRMEAQYALERAAHKLAQDLRRAQEMAMSTREITSGAELIVPTGYGIHFNRDAWPNYYCLFASLDHNRQRGEGRYQDLEPQIFLERGVRIANLQPATSFSILFTPPNPTTWINGRSAGSQAIITISLEVDPTKTKNIRVNNAGLIEIID